MNIRRIWTQLTRGWISLIVLGGIVIVVMLAWYSVDQRQSSPTAGGINYDNPFIAEQARTFDLPHVLHRYDVVIDAIEHHKREHGAYPHALDALVPRYLPAVPGIWIRKGEELHYTPEAEEGGPPFGFTIYGHYPGLAFMHGWTLKFCPAELGLCNEISDRHFYPVRINPRWIWVSSSAL